MKFKSIQYSESYEYQEYGMKRWKKMGIEAELDEGESPIEAHRTLRQCVDEIKAETLTHLEEFRGTTVRDIKEEKVTDKIQSSLDAINQCANISELQNYWIISKGNLTLSAAYKEKEKLLTNAK